MLIFSPHPDDETLACGGLIQHLVQKKIPTKVVFITVGDKNLYPSLIKGKLKFSAEEIVKTGFERKEESIKALKTLGLQEKNLIFLGYPDGKISPITKKPKIKFLHNSNSEVIPYSFSPQFREEINFKNLKETIQNIIKENKPTKIFIPHKKDHHPDHFSTSKIVIDIARQNKPDKEIFQFPIHIYWKLWRIYPKIGEERILFPPKSLSSQKWYSYWLTNKEIKIKQKALLAYKSQLVFPPLRPVFKNFSARNEIFEKLDP